MARTSSTVSGFVLCWLLLQPMSRNAQTMKKTTIGNDALFGYSINHNCPVKGIYGTSKYQLTSCKESVLAGAVVIVDQKYSNCKIEPAKDCSSWESVIYGALRGCPLSALRYRATPSTFKLFAILLIFFHGMMATFSCLNS